MSFVLLLIFGFAPSFIWLLFYLRRDKHPESNTMVLKVFVWGMLIAPVALLLEMILTLPLSPLMPQDTRDLVAQPLWLALISVAFIPALVEEYLKYQVVKQKALTTSHFDEPIDVMLYMVIAALGFAAVENFSQAAGLYGEGHSHGYILGIISIRFVGATLLHTLSSGIFGYFIALSLGRLKSRLRLLGFGFACLIHFCYNSMIVLIEKSAAVGQAVKDLSSTLDYFLLSVSFFCLAVLVLFLVIVAIINLVLFGKLKSKESVCLLRSEENRKPEEFVWN